VFLDTSTTLILNPTMPKSAKKKAKRSKKKLQQYLPAGQMNNPHVKLFKSLLEKGYLTSWSLGEKHGRISSTFTTAGGIKDDLTSCDLNDKNYLELTKAHAFRAFELIREEQREY